MSAKSVMVAILTVAAVCAAADGPALGKWQVTGKDTTGDTWAGVLAIQKVDPSRFDPKTYHSICDLNMDSAGGRTRGVEAPCTWDARTRTVAFGTDSPMSETSFTAVLAADGKMLTNGKWTESKKGDKGAATVTRSGNWSAKLP